MKTLKSLIIIVLVTINCNSITAQQTLVQTTPPTPGNNVIPGPIYVNGSSSDGIYVGKGGGTLLSNLGIGVGITGFTYYPLQSNTTGTANVAIGSGSFPPLKGNTTGSNNIAIGATTMDNNVSGSDNVGVGVGVLVANGSFSSNSAVGRNAMVGNTGDNNCAFGAGALAGGNGTGNTAIGFSASNIGTGSFNTVVGSSAFSSRGVGDSNCVVGASAYIFGSGGRNVAIGYGALSSFLNGPFSSYNNVGIGAYAIVPTVGGAASNELSIQNVIYGINMNSASTGNVAIGGVPTATSSTGILPIGSFAKLQVAGTLGITNTPTSASSVTNYLYVDANGIVGQAPLPGGAGGGITNSCTSNIGIVPRNSDALGNLGCSQIYDNGGTIVTIGAAGTTSTGTTGITSVGIGEPNGFDFNYSALTDYAYQGPTAIPTTGTLSLGVNGVVEALGYYATSDKRYKKNIKTISDALSQIKQLRGVSYNWNQEAYPTKNFNATPQLGFIAQEVETVVPEAVIKDKDGYYAMNYTAIIPVLNEGIKEQQTEIDSLKQELDDLKSKLNQVLSTIPQKTIATDYFEITPNPVTQTSNVVYKLASATANSAFVIYDLDGKIIKQINLPANVIEGQVQISKDDLSKGAYILSLVKNSIAVQSKQFLIME
jgi:hypothetical protein